MAQARELERWLRDYDQRELAGSQHRRAAALWRRRGLFCLVVAAGALAVLVATGPQLGEGPWRGEYHLAIDLQGPPIVRRDRDVRFDWELGAPLPELPIDWFSVRWDSCLVVESPMRAAFRLSSDDGARLLIDGERVIDDWKGPGLGTRGRRVGLEPGVHHLRVEFQDNLGAARIELAASLDGGEPARIDATRLLYPGDEPDPADPCAAVRSAAIR